jgi:hypothetical protein
MIELIEGLPDDTVGVSLKGKIESGDYEKVLIPALEAARSKHDKVNILAVIGPEFDTYSGGALWDDTRFGVRHLSGWGNVAMVSDRDWVHHLSGVGKIFFGKRLRMFGMADLEQAKAWVGQNASDDDD